MGVESITTKDCISKLDIVVFPRAFLFLPLKQYLIFWRIFVDMHSLTHSQHVVSPYLPNKGPPKSQEETLGFKILQFKLFFLFFAMERHYLTITKYILRNALRKLVKTTTCSLSDKSQKQNDCLFYLQDGQKLPWTAISDSTKIV